MGIIYCLTPMNLITAKITNISPPLPSRSGGGTFRCILFRDCNDTAKTYKTHVNSGAINEHKWLKIMVPGIVLSGLTEYKQGLINADSLFNVEDWQDVKTDFDVGDHVTTRPVVKPITTIGIIQYIYQLNEKQNNQGIVYQVKFDNGALVNKRSYEIVKLKERIE